MANSFKLGTSNISSLYLGSNKVNNLYLGNSLLFGGEEAEVLIPDTWDYSEEVFVPPGSSYTTAYGMATDGRNIYISTSSSYLCIYDTKTLTWEYILTNKYGDLVYVNNSLYLRPIREAIIYKYNPISKNFDSETKISYGGIYGVSIVASEAESKIYCIGGAQESTVYLEDMAAYNVITKTWSTLSSVPVYNSGTNIRGAYNKISCNVGDYIYSIGGIYQFRTSSTSSWRTDYQSSKYRYNIKTNTWETLGNLTASNTGVYSDIVSAPVVSVNNKFYFFGGATSTSYYNNVNMYDSETSKWEVKTPYKSDLSGFAVYVNNRVYVINTRYKGFACYIP